MVSKIYKILIVEDDKFLIKIYGDKLERSGFKVSSSLTGKEGLNKIATDKPDVIILDLMLPGMNGFEVLSDLKLEPNTKNIPVIILTNLGQESDIEKGLELGASSYLVKTDISVNKLPELVKEALVKKKKK